MVVSRDDELRELEERLGYVFRDQMLLARAMTHRSFANENDWVKKDNQRLEFLGDSVLGVVIAEALFLQDEGAPEGALSNQLSELVCEGALVEIARDLDLGRFLRLGRGEELSGGRTKEGLLADAYEAMVGAIFLDGGHQVVRDRLLDWHNGAMERVLTGRDGKAAKSPGDFKSYLQRLVQAERGLRPEYRIVDIHGPPHERRFVAEVSVEDRVLGRGEGSSKKNAEQSAAEEAVEIWERKSSFDSMAKGRESR